MLRELSRVWERVYAGASDDHKGAVFHETTAAFDRLTLHRVPGGHPPESQCY